MRPQETTFLFFIALIFSAVVTGCASLRTNEIALQDKIPLPLLNPTDQDIYYVITSIEGRKDTVTTHTLADNDTFLDAIGTVNGLSNLSQKKMWITRIDPNNPDKEIILPVDWNSIEKDPNFDANYKLLSGDRIYVRDGKY